MSNAPYAQSVCFFHTKNLQKTDVFYRQTLKLPMVLDQGACRIYQVSEDGFIGFCTHRESVLPGGIIITLVAEDVETRVATLKALGVTFEKDVTVNEQFNITHAFLRDPNGYLVEIQRFDDPRWCKKTKR